MNRVIHELLGQLTKNELSLLNNPIEPEELGQLVDAVIENKLTGEFTTEKLRSPLSLMEPFDA